MWDRWIIDATMGYPFCFCPIEGDLDGDFTIVAGMNLIGGPPSNGKVVAVLHDGGQEAANKFYAEHRTEIDNLLADANDTHGR